MQVWDVEDLYTPQQNIALRTTLHNHQSAVWSTAVSATGKYFVTGSSDETIKVRKPKVLSSGEARAAELVPQPGRHLLGLRL